MAGVADLVERWNNGFVGSSAPAYGEQCADTDGLAKYLVSDGHEEPSWRDQQIWAMERAQRDLAQRMALPANALRHGR